MTVDVKDAHALLTQLLLIHFSLLAFISPSLLLYPPLLQYVQRFEETAPSRTQLNGTQNELLQVIQGNF